MIPILDMTIDQLTKALEDIGQPAFRATQLADWVYKKAQFDPTAMTNLPPALRQQVLVVDSKVTASSQSEDGTIKLLLEMNDAQRIECVLIPTELRATACVSTQVGCAMGCEFCASGLGGFVRNLTGSEILQQVMHLQQASGRRVTHVVFMGMGEPLSNYEATLWAIRSLIDPERFGISARHITVSTVGIPRAIRRLAKEDLPITLAISLHAPNDVLRKQIMPSAARYTIDELVEAATEFFEARKREVTLEYVLLGGVNDTSVCAEALSQVARRIRCNVNLIRYNPIAGLPYRKPTQAAVQAFAQKLKRRGINVQLRRSRGLDAAAACGQLKMEQPQADEANETDDASPQKSGD